MLRTVVTPFEAGPPGVPAPRRKGALRGRKRGRPQVDPFLGWLIDDQRDQGLTDEQYADRHGLSRPHYSLCKSGDRGLSRPVVEGICKRDPRAREAYVALCLTGYGRRAAAGEEDERP